MADCCQIARWPHDHYRLTRRQPCQQPFRGDGPVRAPPEQFPDRNSPRRTTAALPVIPGSTVAANRSGAPDDVERHHHQPCLHPAESSVAQPPVGGDRRLRWGRGLGETLSLGDSVVAYIHEGASPYLLGQDPSDITRHWSSLHRQRGRSGIGSEARDASAIDIALWDLLSSQLQVPLYQMLGGRSRASIDVYNTCGGPNYVRAPAVAGRQYTGTFEHDRYDDLWAFKNEPEQLAADLLSEGIDAMKIWPFDDIAVETGGLRVSTQQLVQGLEPLRRIREAVGDRMDIALELHRRWSLPAAAAIVRAAEEYAPMWIEDPVRADNLEALAELCRRSGVAILVGETLGSRFAYLDLSQRTGVIIVMSDPVWTGGVTEIRRIADLVAAHQRGFTPHDCTGPVGLVVGTHVSLYVETTIYQEFVRAFRYGWYEDVAVGLPVIDQGSIRPADAAGHGVALIRDDAAREWAVKTSTNGGRPT